MNNTAPIKSDPTLNIMTNPGVDADKPTLEQSSISSAQKVIKDGVAKEGKSLGARVQVEAPESATTTATDKVVKPLTEQPKGPSNPKLNEMADQKRGESEILFTGLTTNDELKNQLRDSTMQVFKKRVEGWENWVQENISSTDPSKANECMASFQKTKTELGKYSEYQPKTQTWTRPDFLLEEGVNIIKRNHANLRTLENKDTLSKEEQSAFKSTTLKDTHWVADNLPTETSQQRSLVRQCTSNIKDVTNELNKFALKNGVYQRGN